LLDLRAPARLFQVYEILQDADEYITLSSKLFNRPPIDFRPGAH
jgi:hypothetical protein